MPFQALARVRAWVRYPLPVLIALCYGLMQLAAYDHSAVFPDSARYVSLAHQVLGADRATADRKAAAMLCESSARSFERNRSIDVRRFNHSSIYDGIYADCMENSKSGMYPPSPRYQEIFSTRPGFPVLMAPLVAAFGSRAGMWATSVLIAIACGLLVFLLMRMLGATSGAAAFGQVLFHALPIGYWASRMLAEGPTMLATLLVLIGAMMILQGRLWGAAVAVPAVAVGAAVKYSSIMLVTAAVGAAAVAIWVFDRERRNRSTVHLAVGAFVTTAVIAGSARLLGLPGMSESLQDTFTSHFDRPDVPDPWYRLAVVNVRFWLSWTRDQMSTPLILLVILAGAIALWRWNRAAALLVCAVSATGIALEVFHPDAIEGDRLYSPVWLTAVVGLPLAMDLIVGRAAKPAEEPKPELTGSSVRDRLDSVHCA